MSTIKSVIDYIIGKRNGAKELAPVGVCPNCWGKQEYDNEIRDMVEDPQIEVNAGSRKYAFIQDFVVNHIDGIRLRSAISGLECPRCKKKIEG